MIMSSPLIVLFKVICDYREIVELIQGIFMWRESLKNFKLPVGHTPGSKRRALSNERS